VFGQGFVRDLSGLGNVLRVHERGSLQDAGGPQRHPDAQMGVGYKSSIGQRNRVRQRAEA